jgi:hypothetical protein
MSPFLYTLVQEKNINELIFFGSFEKVLLVILIMLATDSKEIRGSAIYAQRFVSSIVWTPAIKMPAQVLEQSPSPYT